MVVDLHQAGAGFVPGTQEYGAKLLRMEQGVRSLLLAIGEDPTREGLVDTPKRVAKAFLDMTEGYRQPLHRVLGEALFNEPIVDKGAGGFVLVRDIDFAALSEETLLPFHGKVHIAYQPASGVVLGLSKLARLTRAASKQLQSPHGMALQIISVLQQHLRPQGVAVVVDAKHLSFNCQQPLQAVQLVTAGCFNQPELQLLPELLAMLDLTAQQVHYHIAAPTSSHPCSMMGALRSSSSSSSMNASASAASALQHALTQRSLVSASGFDTPPPAPITPDPSEDSDSDRRSEAAESCEQLMSSSDTESDSMEAAMQQLLAETGVNPGAAAVQASIRRYVLSLLAATSGYHQEHLINACTTASSSSSSDSSSSGGMGLSEPLHSSSSSSQSGRTRGGCICCACSPDGLQRAMAPFGAAGNPLAFNSSSSSRHVCAVLAAAPTAAAGGALPVALPTQQQQQQQQQQQRDLEQHAVPFISQCEHHMLPFYGTVHVALLRPPQHQQQLPTQADAAAELRAAQVAQIVSAYTQRLQVQERITQQVAEACQQLLAVPDVMVVVRAAHMCMVARGVENHAGTTVTRAVTGVFAGDAQLRASFLRMAGQQQQNSSR